MSGHRIAYLQRLNDAWLARERSFDAALLKLRRVRKPAHDRLQFLLATTTDPDRITEAWEDFASLAHTAEDTYLRACEAADINYRVAKSLAEVHRQVAVAAVRRDLPLLNTLGDEKLVVGEVVHAPGGLGEYPRDHGIERSVMGHIPEVGAMRH